MNVIVQPEAGVAPIVQAIRRAKRSIDVCIFRFNLDELEQALAAAVARGVKVRALIAHTNSGGENALRRLEKRLLAAGITVTRSADDLLRYHGKFMVIDSELHVFGFNFTKQDIDKTRSFALSTRHRQSVQEALKLFEADAGRQRYEPSRSNLVVSPETARQMLTDFIKRANKELAIYDEKIQDPAIVRLLKSLPARGVRVRVLGHLKGPDGDVAVRQLKSLRQHVRAIIRDHTHAFVGSQSLRKEELDSRREVGLLIANAAVTRRLMQIFEKDWAESATKKEQKEDDEEVVAVA